MTVDAFSGALSYVVTGGNSELTQQIWQDTLPRPLRHHTEVARMGVGKRPELEEKKNDSAAPQTTTAAPQSVQ